MRKFENCSFGFLFGSMVVSYDISNRQNPINPYTAKKKATVKVALSEGNYVVTHRRIELRTP